MASEQPTSDQMESGDETDTQETPFERHERKLRSTSEPTPRTADSRATSSRIRKSKVVSGLVAGLSVADAAEAAGVKRTTVNQWKYKDREFIQLLAETEDRISETLILDGVQAATLGFKELLPLAVERVGEALKGNDRKLALQAASLVIRSSPKGQGEQVNVESILAGIEASPQEGD